MARKDWRAVSSISRQFVQGQEEPKGPAPRIPGKTVDVIIPPTFFQPT